jgi:hypothetical protein
MKGRKKHVKEEEYVKKEERKCVKKEKEHIKGKEKKKV